MSTGKSEPPEADAQELRSAASAWPTGLADLFEQHGWQIVLSEADCCAVIFLLWRYPSPPSLLQACLKFTPG